MNNAEAESIFIVSTYLLLLAALMKVIEAIEATKEESIADSILKSLEVVEK